MLSRSSKRALPSSTQTKKPIRPPTLTLPQPAKKPKTNTINHYQKPNTNNLLKPKTIPKPGPKLPNTFRKISPAEYAEKKEKGLCFKCDELYTFGHICKKAHLHFVLAEGGEDFTIEEEEEEILKKCQEEGESEIMQISLHALTGAMTHKTIRIGGNIKGRRISILIDRGSSHSFVDKKLVREVWWNVRNTEAMIVLISNGEKIMSKGICRPLIWKMQQYEFKHPVRTLKLGESDMELGVDSSARFSPIQMDFKKLKISFEIGGKKVTLHEIDQEPEVKLIRASNLQK
ncbi:hypothetical protein ACH5RR_034510 [Cinchona calisaya]|uniref:Uncharacterized protein n=1 Tax=Cinchona calisaya TaxID=153742 RepID=A0ABD2YF21_9GENT